MAKKKYVVLGLGIFGSTIARELYILGQDVIGIDRDMLSVQRASDFTTNSLCLDFTDLDALKEAGIENFDQAIVASGTHLEETIMGILNLKELGINNILVKAKNRKYAQVFEKIGVSKIVFPEKEVAKRYAKLLVSDGDIIKLFDIENDCTVFEIENRKKWVNKSLMELDIRSKFKINLLGIKRNNKFISNVDPNEKLLEDDILLLVGNSDVFKNLSDLNK